MSDQQLNTLDRFRKQPGRLVLEEHGHCEVPAGCGGVVLRWRNPFAAVPLVLSVYSPGKVVCSVDGDAVERSRVDLAPGPHAFTLTIDQADLAGPLLLFVATSPSARELPPNLISEVREPGVKVVSDGDGTWKFSLQQPPEGWTAPNFDDRAWPALGVVSLPEANPRDQNSWRWQRCARQGAACLGLPADVPPGPDRAVWVRKAFTIPTPNS